MKKSGPIANLELSFLSAEFNIPAISMASISPTGDIQTNTVGVTRNNLQQKANDETIFEAASLSKPVFAYIVLKMAERGEIDLDLPLYEQSKLGFGPPPLRGSKEYQALTAKNILSHQAGLPNWFKTGAPEEYETPPETTFNYSGLAYCFLQEVVEERSGKSLDDLAQIELKDNLGMAHSSFYRPEDETNLAVGHNTASDPDARSHYPKKSERTEIGKPYPANSAASLFTTPEDYSKFLIACIEDDFVRQHMFSAAVQLSGKDTIGMRCVPDDELKKLSWGLGMGLQQNDDGSRVAFHWGDSETFRNFTAIKFNEKGDYQGGVTCFTNSANGPAVFRQLSEPVVGDLTAVSQWLAKRESLPINPSPTPQVTGQYEHAGPAIVQQYNHSIGAVAVVHEHAVQDPKATDLISQDTVKNKPNK